MSTCPRCGLPLVATGAQCPHCPIDARDAEVPLVPGQLITPPRPARPLPCPEHHVEAQEHCVNCERPLCGHCHFLRINTVPWCLSCGQPYLAPDKWDRQDSINLALRIAVVLAGVVLPFLLLPMFQEVAAIGTGVVLARWLLLRERAKPPQVLEVKPRTAAPATSTTQD
ncbi:MAG: hypothetical protein ABIJ09_16595 [Pseudomonadota bacterium]